MAEKLIIIPATASITTSAGISLSSSKAFSFGDNILENNILAKSVFVANDTRWRWWTKELSGKPVQLLAGRLDGFLCQNNNFFDKGKNAPYLITLGSRRPLIRDQRPLGGLQYSYPELFRDNIELDPLFVDEEARDFHLKASSPMIDAGTFLTRALSNGSGVSLHVEDAGYFYDGYNIPGEVGDLIRLEGQECVARIIGIDYEKNILELSQLLVWKEGQGVSLYHIGSRPDLGAFEFAPGGNHPPIAGFTSYPRASAPLTVELDGSASYDPDGNITEYNWDLGDGTEISTCESRLSHTYGRPDTYTVTLRVTDDSKSQLTGIATLAVSVGQPVLRVQEESLEFGPITRTKSIYLRNTGDGTLVYRISTSARWLSIDKFAGRCTAETRPIIVKVDRTNMKVGQYTGTVTVNAGAAGLHHIEVSMKVPRLSEVKLIDVGDKWRYFKGTAAPPANWAAADFIDSNWLQGPSGIGYSNGDVHYPTFLNDMRGNYMTVYMRRLFEINDIDSVLSLTLGMRYDDGFIAYLNGREIARSRSMGPASTPTRFDKGQILTHDEEDPEEIYHIELKPGWLSADKNVLAVEFRNEYIKSSDACAVPRLTAKMLSD
jgi:PKD repeat protein